MFSLALLVSDDCQRAGQAIGPLLMESGRILVTCSSTDDIARYVDAGQAGCVFAGPSSEMVDLAASALLASRKLVPLVRLVAPHCRFLDTRGAALRIDCTLAQATLDAAIAVAERTLANTASFGSASVSETNSPLKLKHQFEAASAVPDSPDTIMAPFGGEHAMAVGGTTPPLCGEAGSQETSALDDQTTSAPPIETRQATISMLLAPRDAAQTDEDRGCNDGSGVVQYLEACEKLGVTPSTRLLSIVTDQSVSLQQAGVTGKSVEAIAKWLQHNRKCEKLNMTRNRLGVPGVDALANALEHNHNCASLILSGNDAADEHGSPPSQLLRLISNASCSLTCLEMRSNNLYDHGCAAIVRAILKGAIVGKSQPMSRLDLGGNHAALICSNSLAELLSHRACRLRELSLAWSELGSTAAKFICCLDRNSTLRILDLSWSGLEEASATAIAVALRYNQTLVEFDVSNNRISPHGAVAVADGLAYNEQLKRMNISNNPLGQIGTGALLERGAKEGRVLEINTTAPVTEPEVRPVMDLRSPSGYYTLDLGRPYDRWLLNRCVEITSQPTDGSPRQYPHRMHGLIVGGKRVKSQSPSPSIVESWRASGIASFELTSAQGAHALIAVELDLSRTLDRNTALALEHRACVHNNKDFWMDPSISGRPFVFTRNPARRLLPCRGILRFTYVLAHLEPLPEPLHDAAFTLNLRLPWDWWTASSLLDLVHDGFGVMDAPSLNGVAIESSLLPAGLPNSGLFCFNFRSTDPLSEQCNSLFLWHVDLKLVSHRAIARQFAELPVGHLVGGSITILVHGHGEAVQQVPVPLPTSGFLSIEFVPPLMKPDERRLQEGPFAELLAKAKALGSLGDSGSEAMHVLRAAAVRSPFTAEQALRLLNAVWCGATRRSSRPSSARASNPKAVPVDLSRMPILSTQPVAALALQLSLDRHQDAASDAFASAASSISSALLVLSAPQQADEVIGSPSSNSIASTSTRRPQTAPPRRHKPRGTSLTGCVSIEGRVEELMSEIIGDLSPLVALSERGTFLFNAWRFLVTRGDTNISSIHCIRAIAPTQFSLSDAGRAAMAGTSPVGRSPTGLPSRNQGPRQLHIGYVFNARYDPKAPAAERAAGASRMPLPPRLPKWPNQGPRCRRTRFLHRRPEGDFWQPLPSERPLYGASGCSPSIVDA